MIKAYPKGCKEGIKVLGLCNHGNWFGDTWLLSFPSGNFAVHVVVTKAINMQDALDAYADSKWAHLSKIDEKDIGDCYHEDDITRLGNCGEPHDLSECHAERCKVNYFVRDPFKTYREK